MPLVPCKCTNCGGILEVDNANEAAICKYCGTPFIVEKAINIYKTVNITTNTTDWKRLAENGMQMVLRGKYEIKDLKDIRKILREVSEEEFYARFFDFDLEDDDSLANIEWLGKNVPDNRIDEVCDYLINIIKTNNYIKDIKDFHFNISESFTRVLPAFVLNNNTLQAVLFMHYMGDRLSDKAKDVYNYLKNEAKEEIDDYEYLDLDQIYAIGIFANALKDFIGDEYYDNVKNEIANECKSLKVYNASTDFGHINHLKNMGYIINFEYELCDECVVHSDDFVLLGKKLPINNLLASCDYEGDTYIVVKLDSTRGTVVKLSGVNNIKLMYCFNEHEHISFSIIEKLINYNGTYKELKMEYIDKFSYKNTVMGSIFKFFNKIIK